MYWARGFKNISVIILFDLELSTFSCFQLQVLDLMVKILKKGSGNVYIHYLALKVMLEEILTQMLVREYFGLRQTLDYQRRLLNMHHI